jgi:hypothetical protein
MRAVIIGRVASTEDMKTDIGLAARLAALASLGAAVIHFAVVPTHWHEWIPSGLFFVAIASFQLVWRAKYWFGPRHLCLQLGLH